MSFVPNGDELELIQRTEWEQVDSSRKGTIHQSSIIALRHLHRRAAARRREGAPTAGSCLHCWTESRGGGEGGAWLQEQAKRENVERAHRFAAQILVGRLARSCPDDVARKGRVRRRQFTPREF